jgi:hypothetical protein
MSTTQPKDPQAEGILVGCFTKKPNMSTKETLPMMDDDAKELRKWIHSFPWFAGVALRIELRNKEIHSLCTRLDAAETWKAKQQKALIAMALELCSTQGPGVIDGIRQLKNRLDAAEKELEEVKSHKAKLRRACLVGHSTLDSLMGDTDLDSDDSKEMVACNLIALTLKETE